MKTDKYEDLKPEFKDVVLAFNRKYGKGTLFHPGMTDSYAGKNIVKLEELDQFLGLNPS